MLAALGRRQLASRWWTHAELILVIGLAAGLRLYRISDYAAFQGDQGVDALAAKRLLVDHVLPLEGPATSAGGVHLGPFYYYLLAVPMAVAGLDPLADAVFMAVLGSVAVGLTYLVAGEWFGRTAGIVAGGLYAISPPAIVAARSAWNPAPAPFFVLLALGGLVMWRRSRKGGWLVLVGAALSCIIQFHYFSLGLLLVVFLLVGWLAVWRGQHGWGLLGLAAFSFVLLPLVLHEVVSEYPNVRAAAVLLSGGVPAAPDSLPRRLYAVLTPSLISPLVAGGIEPVGVAMTVVLLFGLVVCLFDSHLRFSAGLLAALIGAPLALAVVYRGPIFEHYLIPYWPAVFLGIGAAAAAMRHFRIVQVLGVCALLLVNVVNLPFGSPEAQLARSESVAREIATVAGGERFALWLLADDDSDGAYRFQLERLGQPPVQPGEPPPRLLFVVCQSRPCDPPAVREAIGPDWARSQIDWLSSLNGVELARASLSEQ